MATILNLLDVPTTLMALDGSICLIPSGESRVEDKFCFNIPPKVKILKKDTVEVKKVVVEESIKGISTISLKKLKKS